MPKKALVVLGVLLGMAAFLAPATWAGSAGAAQADSRSVGPAPQRSADPAAAPLTLDQALTRALTQSPALEALAREVEAREGETLQAGLRPNPELSLEVENVAGSGAFSGTDGAETTLALSQTVELGGKRTLRREVGRLDRQLAQRQLENARAELRATATRRFLAVAAAQERLRLAEEQAGLEEQVLAAVRDRIAAGKVAALEGVRFQALFAEARLAQKRARRELSASRTALAALWGSAAPDFDRVAGSIDALAPLPEWSDIEPLAAQGPEVLLQRSAVLRATQAASLEDSQRLPDLTVSLGVRSMEESGDTALVAGVSLPLPLFDRNQGGRQAARARLAKARAEELDARFRSRAAVAEAWQRLSTTRTEVEALRVEILPAAQQVFDAATYGYRKGKFGFLDVLEAQRSLFDARGRYLSALVEYHQAFSDLERLLGPAFSQQAPPAGATTDKRGQS